MSAPKHTPGKWRVSHTCITTNDEGFIIAELGEHVGYDQRVANGQLIAAAPELFQELTKCDAAFVAWQLGQIPGRPEDILALIKSVRAALNTAQRS